MQNKVKGRPVAAWACSEGKMEAHPDFLAVEEPLAIRLGFGPSGQRQQLQLAVTMRTPGDDFDLVMGFLLTEGIVAKPSDVLQIRFLAENSILAELSSTFAMDGERFKRNFFASSSCGICGKASLEAVQTLSCYRPFAGFPKISAALLLDLPEKMKAAQEGFAETGGLHAAALFDATGNLLLLCEDIGRHNALDKVIGAGLRAGWKLPFSDKILLVSGRAGFELVQKATMVGLPMLAAVGAPSSLALELAEASDLSLVGFLRAKKFNLYAGAERLVFAETKTSRPSERP